MSPYLFARQTTPRRNDTSFASFFMSWGRYTCQHASMAAPTEHLAKPRPGGTSPIALFRSTQAALRPRVYPSPVRAQPRAEHEPTRRMNIVSNKTVVITGANSGLGFQMALK